MNQSIAGTAEKLSIIVRTTVPNLRTISEEESLATRGPGTWTRRQILGHLIDSSVNNLHRFIRAQQENEFRFPGYDQPFWVERSGYIERSWSEMVQLWESMNIHLANVMARIPQSSLETPCRIAASDPVPLGFIVIDYVTHLNHHLDQILDPEGSKEKANPPR